ncbi:hypothetical protein PTTG_00624 [Puccinia triticina 1-1 BBBD Race 1]|uniref:Uncharacterized protein n=1 Tax=Puccinia triticina (isolate 1-1 / race 1 (BBBD)) TaxID=630390 RepID=A0A180GNS0_PUCT1|nr:hypothetical protein PTTG_00624 [Puccinia triticina 1-1 BBBD Race 1]
MRFALVAGALVLGATVSEGRSIAPSPVKRTTEHLEFATPTRNLKRARQESGWNPATEADDESSNQENVDPSAYHSKTPNGAKKNGHKAPKMYHESAPMGGSPLAHMPLSPLSLHRMYKRTKGSKNQSTEEETMPSQGINENTPPTFEEYINSFPSRPNRSLHSASTDIDRDHAKLASPKPASEAGFSVASETFPSDIPGFVDIALPDQHAGVARTVSGLAYSMNSDLGTGELELGTSTSHSTQFFMSPIKTHPGSSLYRLRVPVMDSSTFQTVDHCATFPITHAGPLSLKKCGSLPGFSQTFSYDTASGELQPVYNDAPISSLAESNPNLPGHQINKRQFYRVPNCESESAPLSKRDGTPPSAAAIFYFVPVEGVKTGSYPTFPSTNSD